MAPYFQIKCRFSSSAHDVAIITLRISFFDFFAFFANFTVHRQKF